MESFESLRLAIGGHAVRVAKALGLSSSMVHKWCEPSTDFSDSGALNPLDRIETIINTSLREGQPQRNALAPIFYLGGRFDCIVLPPCPKTIEARDYSRQLCQAMKEAGEMFASSAAALEDDALSPNERREIAGKAYQAIATFSAWVRMVESGK